MHQSTTPSLSQTIWPRWASRQFLTLPIVQTLLPVTFAYSLSSEAVVMRQLRRWKRLWRRSLTRLHKRTSMRHSRSCWNGTSALQPEEITSKETRVSCEYYQWKCPYENSLETYRMHLVYISSSSSYRAGSTDIPDPLSPLLPIVHVYVCFIDVCLYVHIHIYLNMNMYIYIIKDVYTHVYVYIIYEYIYIYIHLCEYVWIYSYVCV